MNWTVQPATAADARSVAARMNPADAREVWAAARQTPLQAAEHSVAMSLWARTWLLEGVPACIYGLASPSLIGDSAMVWLLGTDLVKRHKMIFLRHYKAEITRMLDIYPMVYTMVDTRHKVCLRWLKWIGFEVRDAVPFGPDQLPFNYVSMRRA